jgi:WD40 repeat protein
MDPSTATPREFRYDAFISYSRKDREFARRLEQELRGYRPPKDLAVPQRYLRIFRDEADFTGGEYHESLDRNLRDAAKLIVICSPNSAASDYVADEISRFAEHRGKEHVVPILLDGLPNNEAKEEDAGRRAFPEQLVRLLPIPLAADFRGFDTKGGKIRKGAFAPAWFKTLADVYADYGVDRAKIEQREHRRAARRRRTNAAISSAIALVLIGLIIWLLLSSKEVVRQRNSSEAQRLEKEAQLAFGDSGDLIKATLLSVASVRFTRTVDGQISLTRFLELLPKAPLWRKSVAQPAANAGGGRLRALAVSPDGTRIAVTSGSGSVQLLDARTGQPIRSFEVDRHSGGRTVLAFSPDGAFLVLGCGLQACVIDAASGQMVTRLPSEARHGDMVWSASFSPDGQRLAMSSYHSGEVLVYDVATWHTAATIHCGGGSVFSAAFSPRGNWLATGAPPGLQLWRVGHYEAPAARVRTDLVWSIAFQPDGSGLIAAGRRLQAWNIILSGDGGAARLEAAASKPIDAHTVLPVSWRDRSCFAAAAPDAIHLLCGEKLDDEVLRVPVSSVAAAISPDGRWLFNEQNDGMLAASPLDAGLDTARIRLGAPIRSMASADQRGWLAAGMDNGEVAIVGLDSWTERKRLRLPAPAVPVDKVIASADGRWLAVAQGTSLHVFDAGTWREVASRTYEQVVAGAAFVTGDRLVAVTGTTVVVWQPDGWRERLQLGNDWEIEAVRVSPDGRRLATTTRRSTTGHDSGAHLTRVFDLASGAETGWEYTSGGGNISQQFVEDEAARRKRALAGGDTASVREAASSWPALELNEPDERVSADDAWSVAVSGSVAKLSDVASGRAIGDFGHGGEITSVRFVPTRAPRWLVSADEDGTLAVWPIRTDDLADQACARLRTIFGAQALGKLITDAHAERSCEVD